MQLRLTRTHTRQPVNGSTQSINAHASIYDTTTEEHIILCTLLKTRVHPAPYGGALPFKRLTTCCMPYAPERLMTALLHTRRPWPAALVQLPFPTANDAVSPPRPAARAPRRCNACRWLLTEAAATPPRANWRQAGHGRSGPPLASAALLPRHPQTPAGLPAPITPAPCRWPPPLLPTGHLVVETVVSLARPNTSTPFAGALQLLVAPATPPPTRLFVASR